MNLDFSEEQKALKDHVRRFLADRCPPAAVRAVLEGPQPFRSEERRVGKEC